MVNIINFTVSVTELNENFSCFHKVNFVQSTFSQGQIQTETFIDFKTTDSTEVITKIVKEKTFDQKFCIGDIIGVAGTHTTINIIQSLFSISGCILAETADDIICTVSNISKFNAADTVLLKKFKMSFCQGNEFFNNGNTVFIGYFIYGIETVERRFFEQ